MKKQYENPIIDVIEFNEEDVITTSTFGILYAGEEEENIESLF